MLDPVKLRMILEPMLPKRIRGVLLGRGGLDVCLDKAKYEEYALISSPGICIERDEYR